MGNGRGRDASACNDRPRGKGRKKGMERPICLYLSRALKQEQENGSELSTEEMTSRMNGAL